MGAPVDIFEASALGLVDRIAALVSSDPRLVSSYAQDGFYPLGLAAFFGHLDAVRALIAAGPVGEVVTKVAYRAYLSRSPRGGRQWDGP